MPVVAMCVRIYPHTWSSYPSLQLEVLGCAYHSSYATTLTTLTPMLTGSAVPTTVSPTGIGLFVVIN